MPAFVHRWIIQLLTKLLEKNPRDRISAANILQWFEETKVLDELRRIDLEQTLQELEASPDGVKAGECEALRQTLSTLTSQSSTEEEEKLDPDLQKYIIDEDANGLMALAAKTLEKKKQA